MKNIILNDVEPGINPDSEELSRIIIERIGLMPKKKGSTEKMNQVLLQLYEKSKAANREKNPTLAIMTVEEMALYAGITRQTMYDYLKRWLTLNIIIKNSFIDRNNKVVIGYRLNGATLENAFEKCQVRVKNNLEQTRKFIVELQRIVKNEKIKQSAVSEHIPD
ncbi:MAG: hypothetical protein GXP63_05190 [DPANN group archaeon]|nr:hypothetical protein [DPANN group archaeon]